MRIVLIGAVESTAVALRTMAESGWPPVAVISLAPDLAHRHSDFVDMGPLAAHVGAEFIPVRSANTRECAERIAALAPDWLVVIGWSQIIQPALLQIAKVGTVGYHPAPLPELRGRAVLAWTILLDRTWTAGSLFTLEPEVDSGRILSQQRFDLDPRETVETLIEKHLAALRDMLRDLLPKMARGPVEGVSQEAARVSFCAKRTAADGRIAWDQAAEAVDRLVRAAGRPYAGAFTERGNAKIVIWEAEPWTGQAYYGLPGQVVDITPDRLLIACKLGDALSIRRWEWIDPSGGPPPRVGDALGR